MYNQAKKWKKNKSEKGRFGIFLNVFPGKNVRENYFLGGIFFWIFFSKKNWKEFVENSFFNFFFNFFFSKKNWKKNLKKNYLSSNNYLEYILSKFQVVPTTASFCHNVVSHKKSRKNDQISKKGVWPLLYSPNQIFLGHAIFASC